MRKYKTVGECLEALSRGCIVDAKENAVPRAVIAALLKKNGEWQPKHKCSVLAHRRYEGGREIIWFCNPR